MKLDTLIPYVALTAPAAPDPLIVEMLRLALDELATRTGFWIETTDTDVELNEATYKVPLPAGLVMRRLEEVRLNGTKLEPENLPDWMHEPDDWPAQAGLPETYAMVEPTTIVLGCLPAIADGDAWKLQFRASVRPGSATVNVPDWIALDQRDALVSGAKKLLASMPDRAWTNPTVEARETAAFERAVSDLSWRVAKGFTSAGPSGRARFL